jgi:hypothetical protein
MDAKARLKTLRLLSNGVYVLTSRCEERLRRGDGELGIAGVLQAGSGPYTVNLTFPDGRTESRSATNNWLNWDGTLRAGNYTWTVPVTIMVSNP